MDHSTGAPSSNTTDPLPRRDKGATQRPKPPATTLRPRPVPKRGGAA